MSEVLGIDVSHHNGRIDWTKVAQSKKFAIMKAQYEAQSHRIDETFEYNYAEAGKYGLARGVYIYIARHSIADPVADANALVSKLKGRKLEYGIWLDLEDKNIRHLTKQQFNDLVTVYASIFKAAGYYVGIYCNVDWYKNVLDSHALGKVYEFWIARYPKNDTGEYNPQSNLKPKYGCAWQYSSKGKVSGITGNVDLNVDYDGVINLAGGTTPKPVATPEPAKPATPELYSVGKTYTLQSNMFIRKEPNGQKLTLKELTPDGKRNAVADVEGHAVIKKGTRVTCKETRNNGAIWMRTPSGWICAKAASGKKFIS